jgi:hypothetical protein
MLEFFRAAQELGVAHTVRDSLWITATLSALHLFGVTLVGGAALLSGLRAGGLLWREQPLEAIVRPAVRAIAAGVVLAMATGVFLAAPRAVSASRNGFFQWKMASLLVVIVVQSFVYRRIGRNGQAPAAASLLGAAACLSVIGAGAAFILLE